MKARGTGEAVPPACPGAGGSGRRWRVRRSRKAPDEILIQVLLNGFCATLPLPEVAPGFYRWSDFKARFNKLAI